MTDLAPIDGEYAGIHSDIVALIETARRAAARSINALMTATYWEIGRRIVEFEQRGQERAAYGEAMIKRLGTDLSRQFGRGFGWRNLAQMRAFYLAWPSSQILQTLSAKSSPPQILQTVSGKSKSPDSVWTIARSTGTHSSPPFALVSLRAFTVSQEPTGPRLL